MKKLYNLLSLLFCIGAYAQCPPGSVTFTSQAQLNNFLVQYPTCTTINGDVSIEGNISNLNALANITTITGSLEIREVSNLEDLDGLENLTTVGMDLVLREVDDLENIEALTSLTSIGGEFTLRECPDLETLNGVENLTTVGLGLIVRECGSLTSIQGLSGVTTVGEILEVVDCPLLTSLAGLENIMSIAGGEEGAIVIEGNTALTSLDGLGNASTVISGGVLIASNNVLSYCSVPAICNFLQNPPPGAIIDFGNNVTGCNTPAEVLAQCVPPVPPAVTGFSPANGCVGSEMVVTGTDFNMITSVTIGGTPADFFVGVNEILVVVPSGPSGTITVTNAAGSSTSAGTFTVNPQPDPVIITGGGSICIGEVVQLTAASGTITEGFVWTPATNLYTNPEATVPYTGTPVAIVYARPTTAIIYTAIIENNTGCTASATTTIDVTNTPAPPAAASQFVCNSGTLADLMANGTNIQWYAAPTGGTVLPEDTVLIDGGVYYASQTANGCESVGRTQVTAHINTTPTPGPGGEGSQIITVDNPEDATLEDLVVDLAEGGSVTWYASMVDAQAGTSPLPMDTQLETGITYYAVQTLNGCRSEEIFGVTVNVVLGNEEFEMAGFSYYPNPVADVLNITHSANITSVAVYDLLGQQVLAVQPEATTATLSMASLSRGLYMVNITAGNATKTIKIVKAP